MKYLVDPLQELIDFSEELDEAIAKVEDTQNRLRARSDIEPIWDDALAFVKDVLERDRLELASRRSALQS